MAIRIESVHGPDAAAEASMILREAWQPPTVHYTEEYLRWQLSFPSPFPIPAFMAFDGTEPVGFAGMTARRFRCGSDVWDSGIVSFAAVRPQWRNSVLGIVVYKELFSRLRDAGLPFIGFGVQGSHAREIFTLVLNRVRLQVLSLGTLLTHYYAVTGSDGPDSEWEATIVDRDGRAELSSALRTDSTVISCDPTDDQWTHYWRDPRGRALVSLRHRSTGERGIAWVVQGEYLSTEGVRIVPTVESVYLPSYDVRALPSLFRATARWAGSSDRTFVNAANLSGFQPESLRAAGIRNFGRGFLGICCAATIPAFLEKAQSTTVEIV